MRKRFDSNRIELLLPNPWRWPARGVALCFLVWLVVLFFGAESGFGVSGWTRWVSVAIVLTGLYALNYLRADHKRRHGRLHADRHGVEFDAEKLVPRSHLLAVHLVSGRRTKVQISRLGHMAPIEIRVESLQDGRTIVEALGLEMSQGTAQYELPVAKARRWVPLAALSAAIGLVVMLLAGPEGLMLSLCSIAVAVGLVRARRLVAVGSDGVLIRYWFWTRFVELREVVQLKHIERTTVGASLFNGIDLVLRSRETLRLLAPSDFMYDADEGAYPLDPFGHQMMDRLNHLIARIGSAGETGSEAKLLRRNGRSAAEWFEELRGIGSGSSRGYRTAPVAASALWQLLEDPGTEPSVRAGAAAALTSSSAHRDPHRLGATTATVLAPKLRRALDKIGQAKRPSDLIRALESVADD